MESGCGSVAAFGAEWFRYGGEEFVEIGGDGRSRGTLN